jgi:hypothetical protein
MSVIPEAYQNIAHTVQQTYQSMVESAASRTMDALWHKLNNTWKRDCVRYIGDVGDIQQAPNAMIPWIMANPRINTLYHEERIVGYGDRYVDPYPDLTGTERPDYQSVATGVIFQEEDRCQATTYLNYEMNSDLSVLDRLSIVNTWRQIEKELDEELTDPTDEWNGTIR